VLYYIKKSYWNIIQYDSFYFLSVLIERFPRGLFLYVPGLSNLALMNMMAKRHDFSGFLAKNPPF